MVADMVNSYSPVLHKWLCHFGASKNGKSNVCMHCGANRDADLQRLDPSAKLRRQTQTVADIFKFLQLGGGSGALDPFETDRALVPPSITYPYF